MNQDEQWKIISDIRTSAAKIEQAVKDHTENKAVHHTPPCQELNKLDLKFWGILVIVIGMAMKELLTK